MHTSLTNYSYLKKNYLIEIINCLLYSELVRCIYDQLMNGEEHEHDAQQMAFSMARPSWWVLATIEIAPKV